MVPVFAAEESPRTPAEVEPRFTGAVIGATTCVPEPIPSEPLVVLPPAVPEGAVPPAEPGFVTEESPSTPAAMEAVFTGAVIGATTCVPEPIPSEPLVVLPPAVPEGAVPPAEPGFVTEESPSTPAAMEAVFTGAVIGATTWVPEPRPSEPLVEVPEDEPPGAAGAALPAEPEVAAESPATPTAVAPMLTGTDIGATT
jgi:hypothetical protein